MPAESHKAAKSAGHEVEARSVPVRPVPAILGAVLANEAVSGDRLPG